MPWGLLEPLGACLDLRGSLLGLPLDPLGSIHGSDGIKNRTFATNWVGNRICELSIGATESEICDLSLLQWFWGVISGCWWPYNNNLMKKGAKNLTSATAWVGNRICELSIGAMESEIWDLSLLQWLWPEIPRKNIGNL